MHQHAAWACVCTVCGTACAISRPDGGLLHGIGTVDRWQLIRQNLLWVPWVDEDPPLVVDPDARCDGIPQCILGFGAWRVGWGTPSVFSVPEKNFLPFIELPMESLCLPINSK